MKHPRHPSSTATDAARKPHLRLERAAGVITVGPEQDDRPALTAEIVAELRDVVAELVREGRTRVLVLGGGGHGFWSSADPERIVAATLALGAGELLALTRTTGQVVRALREAPFPVVAGMRGTAAGAAAALALAADFRVADPGARFVFPFTRAGLAGADAGAAYLLPRLVGLGRASRLLLLGDPLDAAEAERIGLVGPLAPEDGVAEAADQLAHRLAAGPAPAHRETKALLTAELDLPLGAAVDLDAAAQALLLAAPDHAAFPAAPTTRPEPEWEGH